MVVQHFCKIVCRVPGKRIKSKFLYQDADVILPADKCIVVRSIVCRNYDKVLMETGKFSDNLRVKENRLVSGVDRAFKSSNSTFQNISDRLNPFGKSVDFDILFLGPPSVILLTRVHDEIKILVPLKWDRSCSSGPCANHLSVFGYGRYYDHLSLYGHMERIEIQNHSRNNVWDFQKDHRSLFAVDLLFNWKFWSNQNGIAIRNAWRLLVLKVWRDFTLIGHIFDSTCCLCLN